MTNKFSILLFFCVGVIMLSGCQSSSNLIQNNTEETINPSYTTEQISATISCDDYSIQSIKDFGYTGEVIPQGTGCVINGTKHTYGIDSLGIRIIFDNTITSYFLDQSKIPEIILQDNIIIYDKDHTLTVVKNYTDTVDHYIQATYRDCEYNQQPIATNEYQIKCEGSNYLYFHNISMVDSTIYDMQYALGNQGFRFEII